MLTIDGTGSSIVSKNLEDEYLVKALMVETSDIWRQLVVGLQADGRWM